MSSGLLRSVWVLEPYLHSPVDNLRSFYYTMQWVAVHNNGSSTRKHKTNNLKVVWARISSSVDNRFQVLLLVHRICHNNQEDVQKFGTFLAKLQLVLKEWYP
jgi:hypothetical protein